MYSTIRSESKGKKTRGRKEKKTSALLRCARQLARARALARAYVRERESRKKCEYECATDGGGREYVYKCRDEAGKIEGKKRERKKDMKQTKSAPYVRTPSSSSLPTIHVCCSRRTLFFLFSFSLSLILADVEFTHRLFLCLFFSEH